ncbi:MAG TPA: hypothetical protein VH518_09270, partial [Tepidisphaeraceae bacterium]
KNFTREGLIPDACCTTFPRRCSGARAENAVDVLECSSMNREREPSVDHRPQVGNRRRGTAAGAASTGL